MCLPPLSQYIKSNFLSCFHAAPRRNKKEKDDGYGIRVPSQERRKNADELSITPSSSCETVNYAKMQIIEALFLGDKLYMLLFGSALLAGGRRRLKALDNFYSLFFLSPILSGMIVHFFISKQLPTASVCCREEETRKENIWFIMYIFMAAVLRATSRFDCNQSAKCQKSPYSAC